MSQDKSPQELLHEHYKALPTEELLRQGSQRLRGDVRHQARRTLRVGWIITWSVIIAGVVLGGTVALWLLFMAKHSGSHFAETRAQAMKVYTTDDDTP